MKTTLPPDCQGAPDMVADKRVLVRYRDTTGVETCPYGQTCRIVTGGEGGVANVHVITVNQAGLHSTGSMTRSITSWPGPES